MYLPNKRFVYCKPSKNILVARIPVTKNILMKQNDLKLQLNWSKQKYIGNIILILSQKIVLSKGI